MDTTGAAFLGLTLGCARCHDHKFDPLSQRDYHRMMAVFAASEETRNSGGKQDGAFGFKSGYPRLLQVEEYKAAIQRIDQDAEGGAKDETQSASGCTTLPGRKFRPATRPRRRTNATG